VNQDPIPTEPGYRIYNRTTLRFYDFLVHGISNRWFWNCPTRELQAWMDQHATDNHLDVGVGTGYFLDRSRKLSSQSRVGLLDANRQCLDATSARIARYHPEVYERDLADDLAGLCEPFDSLSLMYVIHCLPGDPKFRNLLLDNCKKLVLPRGCLFGATILGDPKPNSYWGRRLMRNYQRKGIFGNQYDSADSIEQMLEKSLDQVKTNQIGNVLLFAGIAR